MKMINNGKAFDMSFNGEDVHVPVGKFDCSIPALAYHIVDTATKWNMNVEILDSSDLDAKPAAAIKPEPITKGTGEVLEPLPTKKEETKEKPKQEEVKEEKSKLDRPSKK